MLIYLFYRQEENIFTIFQNLNMASQPFCMAYMRELRAATLSFFVSLDLLSLVEAPPIHDPDYGKHSNAIRTHLTNQKAKRVTAF
jgi:hypothetical protein